MRQQGVTDYVVDHFDTLSVEDRKQFSAAEFDAAVEQIARETFGINDPRLGWDDQTPEYREELQHIEAGLANALIDRGLQDYPVVLQIKRISANSERAHALDVFIAKHPDEPAYVARVLYELTRKRLSGRRSRATGERLSTRIMSEAAFELMKTPTAEIRRIMEHLPEDYR